MPRHRPHIRLFHDSENGDCAEIIGYSRMPLTAARRIREVLQELREDHHIETVEVL